MQALACALAQSRKPWNWRVRTHCLVGLIKAVLSACSLTLRILRLRLRLLDQPLESMTTTFAEVEEKARQLPSEDRARLALLLIESLESGEDGDINEAWRLEVESRWATLERGEAQTVPASEVFAEVRRALR